LTERFVNGDRDGSRVNLIARLVPIPTVVAIPTTFPENPCTVVTLEMFSYVGSGNGTKTCGTIPAVYPKPGFVIDTVDSDPFTILMVAVAVVPIPTPIDGGAEILTVTADPIYPLPGLLIVSDEIVPATETVAVTASRYWIWCSRYYNRIEINASWGYIFIVKEFCIININ